MALTRVLLPTLAVTSDASLREFLKAKMQAKRWCEDSFCFIEDGCNEEKREGWDGEEKSECFDNYGMDCDCTAVREGNDCVATGAQIEGAVRGHWKPMEGGCSNDAQEISFTVGTTSGYSITDTHEWGVSVTASMESGFEAAGLSATQSVSATVSQSWSHAYTENFSETKSDTKKKTFADPGCVFQWVFDVDDTCGTSKTETAELMLTPSKDQPPCCLPGMFSDPADAFSACRGDSPSMCDEASSAYLKTKAAAKVWSTDGDHCDGGFCFGDLRCAEEKREGWDGEERSECFDNYDMQCGPRKTDRDCGFRREGDDCVQDCPDTQAV